MTAAAVRFEGAGEGETVHFAGETLTVIAPRAYAPGAPIALRVLASEELSLTGRTIGSKRTKDGRFTVRIRLTNLRRAERLGLEALHPAQVGA